MATLAMSYAMPHAIVPAAPDETTLVARARAGEREAFDELMRAHQRAVFGLALRYLGDSDEAADLCQRAFVRAFQSLPLFRGEARFRTWLFRIAMRLAADALRSRRRTERLGVELDVAAAPAVGELPADLARLRVAVEGLPPRQRAVVELRTYEAMSFRDVARVLGTTTIAAKVNYHYAVKRLRKELLR